MPITKSAKKALRQSKKRRERNLAQIKKMKSVIKDFKKSLSKGGIEEAQKNLPSVYKVLDKAAKVNLIKKNKASRLKSRLSHQLKTAKEVKQSS